MANYDNASARATVYLRKKTEDGGLLEHLKFRTVRYNSDLPGEPQVFIEPVSDVLTGALAQDSHGVPASEIPIERVEVVDSVPFSDVARFD